MTVCVRISLHSLLAATGAKTDGTIIPRLLVKVIAADTADLQHDLPQRLTPAVWWQVWWRGLRDYAAGFWVGRPVSGKGHSSQARKYINNQDIARLSVFRAGVEKLQSAVQMDTFCFFGELIPVETYSLYLKAVWLCSQTWSAVWSWVFQAVYHKPLFILRPFCVLLIV